MFRVYSTDNKMSGQPIDRPLDRLIETQVDAENQSLRRQIHLGTNIQNECKTKNKKRKQKKLKNK